MGPPPVGVTVTVFDGPAAINENHTSLTTVALHILVVLEDVAPTELAVMHTFPLGGIIAGWAVTQLLLAG